MIPRYTTKHECKTSYNIYDMRQAWSSFSLTLADRLVWKYPLTLRRLMLQVFLTCSYMLRVPIASRGNDERIHRRSKSSYSGFRLRRRFGACGESVCCSFGLLHGFHGSCSWKIFEGPYSSFFPLSSSEEIRHGLLRN